MKIMCTRSAASLAVVAALLGAGCLDGENPSESTADLATDLISDPASGPAPEQVGGPEQPSTAGAVATHASARAAGIARTFASARHGVPIDHMEILDSRSQEVALLGRTFEIVTLIDDRQAGAFHRVYVDAATGETFTPDEVDQALRDATVARYGKLDPRLAEALPGLDADGAIPVVIWAVEPPGLGRHERQQAALDHVAALFPEAAAVAQRGGSPLDVADPVLAPRIDAAYRDALLASNDQALQPLLETMKRHDLAVTPVPGIPAVFATLTRQEVQQVMDSETIGRIMLSGGEVSPASLAHATGTNRVQAVRSRKLGATAPVNDGTGVKVALIEANQNVDMDSSVTNGTCPSNNCFRNPGATRDPLTPVGNHATLVASIVASTAANATGVAPGATILSGSISTGEGVDFEFADAYQWAWQQGADVINLSVGQCPTEGGFLLTLDMLTDYAARSYNKLFVVAAGNVPVPNGACWANVPNDFGTWSPGKAWNVVTVGGYNPLDDTAWGNDTSVVSPFWNPESPSGDREKPEVVAPSVNIDGIGVNGAMIPPQFGTSMAAPQVSGMAALMIQRSTALRTAPNALRAIILASASHNITGPSGPVAGVDDLDGAGGIHADLADLIAATQGSSTLDAAHACVGPCWWKTRILDSSPEWTYFYFKGQAGDRIRAAAAWWSSGYCPDPSNCEIDRLDTDFNMFIEDAAGNRLSGAFSASLDNNYEVVPTSSDVILPASGTYRIAVHTTRMDEDFNDLGVAWTKVAAGPGTYDAQHHALDGKVIYRHPAGEQSLWGTLTDVALAAWNTLTYTSEPQRRAIFPFNGTSVSLLYSMASNRGRQSIFIDGVLKESFLARADETRRQVIRSWTGLPSGDHTIEVRSDGEGLMEVDAFANGIATMPAGSYDDAHGQNRYFGAWEALTGVAGTVNGTMHRSSTAGDVMRFTFVGNGITWKFSRDATRGIAAVTLDGVHQGYYDLYGPTLRQQTLDFPALGPGTHTFHITVTGRNNNAGATSTYVDVDELIVR